MSGNKHPLQWLCFLALAWTACTPSAKLDPRRAGRLSPKLFEPALPGLRTNRHGFLLNGFNDTIETYVAHFSEQYIEQDDLLTLSTLGDSSSHQRVTYDKLTRYSQSLFIFHLRTEPDGVDVLAYLAAHYGPDGKCIALKPAYLGMVNRKEGYINFLYEIKLKVCRKGISFVPVKKLFRLKKLPAGKFDTHLLFLSKDIAFADTSRVTWWKPTGVTTLNVSKIVDYDPNKIGGPQAIIFDIHKIMPDEAAIKFIFSNP